MKGALVPVFDRRAIIQTVSWNSGGQAREDPFMEFFNGSFRVDMDRIMSDLIIPEPVLHAGL
ncbi:MAG: hypothetical protein ACU843_05900, partial [Gammaproteobacteria bacterium]